MQRNPVLSPIAALGLALMVAPSPQAQRLAAAPVSGPAYEALGQASLDVLPGEAGERARLVLTNLGDAGRDGLVIRPGAAGFPEVAFTPADAPGATLNLYAFAEGAPTSRALAGRLQVAESDLLVSARFAGGGGRQRVSVYDGPDLVGEWVIAPGEPVTAYNFFEAWPCKWKGFQLDGKGTGAFFPIGFEQPTQVALPDGTTAEGDLVVIQPAEPVAAGALERAEVRVSGIESITLVIPDGEVSGPAPATVDIAYPTIEWTDATMRDARAQLTQLRRQRRDGPVPLLAVEGGPSFFATLQRGRVVNYFARGADGEPLPLESVTTSEEGETTCWVCGEDEDGNRHCVIIECPVIVWEPGDEDE